MDKDEQDLGQEGVKSKDLAGVAPKGERQPEADARRSQEGPGANEQAEALYEGGIGEERLGEASGAPREGISEGDSGGLGVRAENEEGGGSEDFLKESERKQSELPGKEARKTKRSWMVLALLLVLTVAAVAVWWFWGHRGE